MPLRFLLYLTLILIGPICVGQNMQVAYDVKGGAVRAQLRNLGTAPVEVRERLAFAGNGAVEDVLRRLSADPDIDEAVIRKMPSSTG